MFSSYFVSVPTTSRIVCFSPVLLFYSGEHQIQHMIPRIMTISVYFDATKIKFQLNLV